MVQRREQHQDDLRLTPAAILAAVQGDMGNFLAATTPGGIEAQESAGQKRLVSHADRLPIRGTIDRPGDRAKWEAVGFTFGDEIPNPPGSGTRPQFVACTFPAGWKLVATGHSMWSDVVDDKGAKRAQVFFKAAFYDYSAHTFGLDCG